eukprot:1716792-Prymnesium_polylepis.1
MRVRVRVVVVDPGGGERRSHSFEEIALLDLAHWLVHLEHQWLRLTQHAHHRLERRAAGLAAAQLGDHDHLLLEGRREPGLRPALEGRDRLRPRLGVVRLPRRGGQLDHGV